MMPVYTKQILFVVAGIVAVGAVGYWEPSVQHLLGLFAIGWTLSDIAGDVFPEN